MNALTTTNAMRVATGDFNQYVREIADIPVLTAEEEQALAVRLRNENDLDAARKLIIAQLRFVVHIARGYQGYGLPLGDLVQEGNVGLMKAVKRFDPEVGVRLISFAVHWIRAEIHDYIIRNWRIVKVATTKAQRKLFFRLRGAKKHLGWFNDEEVKAVANDLGVPEKQVLEMEQRLSGHDASFDLTDSDDDNAVAPVQYLASAENHDPAKQFEDNDTEETATQALSYALDQLDDRSRDILSQRWLDEDQKATLQDLADHYQVSAERIRQIESAAMKKLKKIMLENSAIEA